MIAPAEYQILKEILLANSGHHLGEGKEYLVERRLESVAGSLGFPNLTSLIHHVHRTRDPKVVKLVCEAMTTNESLFFRDGRPFDLMKERILPDLIERRRATRRLRIWSAACSTGQEAYSLAMLLAEFPGLAGWTLEIIGTDYSPKVVARARDGVFNHFEVQRGLPIQMLLKYFDQGENNSWRAKESLRRMVSFREGNLLEPFRQLGPFDVVFCRNVLIYFDDEGKRAVLNRMVDVVASDGYLFLGASETALGVSAKWGVVPDANTTLFQRSDGIADERRRGIA